jgi:hypothetical protein
VAPVIGSAPVKKGFRLPLFMLIVSDVGRDNSGLRFPAKMFGFFGEISGEVSSARQRGSSLHQFLGKSGRRSKRMSSPASQLAAGNWHRIRLCFSVNI